MANYPRYAIYYTSAPDSALDQFGASLLGYDAHGGEDLPFPDGLPSDWRDLTHDPRKYGFHATLKAPIALGDGKAETRPDRKMGHLTAVADTIEEAERNALAARDCIII